MKALAVLLLLFSLSLVSAESKAQEADPPKEVPVGEEFTIKAGQQVNIQGTKIKITFLRVSSDSRCPVDVVCGWAGNATLNFTGTNGICGCSLKI